MTLGPRPMLAHKLSAIAGALVVLASPAIAQQAEAPASAAGMERAQKAADAVFHWIKINADKGGARPTAAPAPAPHKPAAVAAAPRPAVAPAPAPTPTTERVQALSPAPAPAAAPVTAAAAASEPKPEPDLDRKPVLLASTVPTPAPAPATPQAVAVKAAEPPPAPAEEEVPLRLLYKVDPAIPRQLQAQNFRTGFAQVQFTVGADGTVIQAQAVKSSHARLATAAVEAVKQWRFAPIGKPRDAAVEVAFRNDVE
ncbi:TonB family protein [Roseateles sp.]|uniref:TonB family protein n=1 Tax=Roseateles sp. TaxID=1971397 RepID=UPI002DFD5376|nr:TonB family protein [Roseateles sp.]HEV6965614.1 TonB family protein [Roseateles sp.]